MTTPDYPSARTDNSTPWVTQWLPGALIIAVIAYYFSFVLRHAINVPLADDIYDILMVLSEVIATQDREAALQILYAQHNDHRTLASRLLYGLTYLANGEINFRTLTVLANAALPLLLLALYLMARQHRLRYLVILPAALVLFQLRAYGITLWSMAAFAYFYVFLYGFYSLYCLHEVTPGKFVLAIILAFLATFTLASGQMVWLVGLVSLLQQSFVRSSASRQYPLYWALAGLTAMFAWRLGLQTPNTLAAMLANFSEFPGHHVLYTLTLLGSAVTGSSVAAAALAGAAMLVILVTASVHSFRHADPRLEFCCWFVVLSVMAMVLGRSFTNVDYALSSRYSFPSVLMLATSWVLMAVRLDLKQRSALVFAVLLAGTYCITSYRIYAKALQPHIEKRVQIFNQGRYWAWPHPIEETNAIVERAISLGIYTPPSRPMPAPAIFQVQPAQVEKL